ncbi:DUF885 domain-containing protein [Dokdonella fugitiva]|jgi:uncharacterized protein (DUF885 family)|uniref:Uncharacterized protein DUF885 n=1 Tax=Dokdonella fugitiva TaxID=328517 RepID=A0A4R2I3Y3_9GAMM|nr:DUF885 domain-containing protein [Dokdonella fugitiva]MBA8884166.1 uncharacterized protein (DUF885 family) [Dokdonella fugitiva]TCO38853.1 uncharacterized protein DUF885 [Dokdonella fugitiva]
MRRLLLSSACALACLALAAPDLLAADAKKPEGATASPVRPNPAWVKRSNEVAQPLLRAQAEFAPEFASFFGLPGYDDRVADLKPNNGERLRTAMRGAKETLEKDLETEENPNVRQDIGIMIGAADRQIEGSELNDKLMVPFADVGQLVFQGEQGLLQDQVAPERRAHALARLEAYVGLKPGTTPITTLARQRYEERASNTALVKPTRLEVEQALRNAETYTQGIRDLFGKYKIEGSDAALAALDKQMKEYADWMRGTVLPSARTDTRLPPELYAFQLKQVGIDITPQELIQRAELEFMETRATMQQLAPLVARAKGLHAEDYREVIHELKKKQLDKSSIENYYRKTVMPELEKQIAAHRVVDLPNRPMVMRLASPAESASQPAPHFLPAPLIGNSGQQGQFVLPLGNPASEGKDGKGAAYDDFTYEAGGWTLTAHEGRPGHELQFTAMVERGVSLARTLFAFNSVNVEGWALYAEAEMVPYEPLDGQLIALQLRLLRAARAMLDPMLNLGLIDRERAGQVLTQDVALSEPMARQELDRYTFNMPGQAGAYFYGYSRIMQLRMETELALGAKFDRMAYNNFLLDQGLLPPDQLAKAVREVFVPAQRTKK